MIEFARFGAGRIGRIHAASLARQPSPRWRYVVKALPDTAGEVATPHGARFTALTERTPVRASIADGERALALAGATTRS